MPQVTVRDAEIHGTLPSTLELALGIRLKLCILPSFSLHESAGLKLFAL